MILPRLHASQQKKTLKSLRSFSAFLLGLCMVSGSALFAADIVVALKPDKNPDAMRAEKENLQKLLSKKLKRPVKVIVPLSSAVILEGLSNSTIDLAYLSSLDLHNAREQNIAQSLLAAEIKGKTSYESYWVSLKGKNYKSVADLKGKPVAFASRTSTSGYLIPFADLIKNGFLKKGEDPQTFFGNGNVWYGTGYVSAIERVLRGEAEAAAVSDYVMLESKHLTEEQKAKLQVIDRQGPVPTHILATRLSLSEKDRESLRTAIQSLKSPDEVALRDRVFGSKLVEVNDAEHLKGTSEALELTGLKM